MSLPYKKWTEDQIKSRNISSEGEYPFTVLEAVLKKTKGGLNDKGQPKDVHPMLELILEFHDQNGVVKKQRDWIVFCEGMDWKMRHLADTLGLIDLYEDDALEAHHLPRKHGVFSLGIREDEYQGEKRKANFVKDYVKKQSTETANSNAFLSDDIPL
jgi:hypothetical protein